MKNWGFLTGMQGLYAGPSKREVAKEELATLSILSDEIKKKRLQEEQDALKMEEYNNQVSAFAASLLGPDRDRINAKARLLGNNVREMLKSYGGDSTKFLQNGGHRIMSEYRNNVINSEEASVYLENKKNAEMIAKVTMSGKGHLLSPIDIINLQNYQKNGSGRITYAGMMSEIEMPDPMAYDYGSEIPAEDILRTGQNNMAIVGNYYLTHGKMPESKEDLIAFVNSNYKQIGKSTAKQDMAFRQQQMDLSERGVQLQEKTFQWNQQKDIAEYQRKQMEAMADLQTKFGTSGTEFMPNYYTQLFNQTSGVDIDNWDNYWDNNNNAIWKTLKTGNVTKYTEVSRGINPKTQNTSLIGWNPVLKGAHDLLNWANEDYVPTNAYQVFSNEKLDIAAAAFNIDDTMVDRASNSITITPGDHWMWGDGVNVKDRGVKTEKYAGKFIVKSIVTGGSITNPKSGNQQLVMDVYDNGKMNQKKTEDYRNAIRGTDKKSSEVKPELYAVLENEDGVIFYAPIGTDSESTMQSLRTNPNLQHLETSGVIKDMNIKDKRLQLSQEQTQQISQQTLNFYNALDMEPSRERMINSEASQINPMNPGSRKNLIKSYYASMVAGSNNPLEYYDAMVASGTFGVFIAQMKSLGYTDIEQDLRSGMPDQDIINKINSYYTDQSDIVHSEIWKASYKDLNSFTPNR